MSKVESKTYTRIYGPSTGETGLYGVGDIVKGQIVTYSDEEGLKLDDEPVYSLFLIEDNEIVYDESNN